MHAVEKIVVNNSETLNHTEVVFVNGSAVCSCRSRDYSSRPYIPNLHAPQV